MRIVFSRRFDRDLDRLYQFLITNKATSKTAHKALATIRKRAQLLANNSKRGLPLNDEMGRYESYIKFGKNNYILRYIPDEKANTVYVLRVWHSREERGKF